MSGSATPQMVAHQAALPMGLSRQEYGVGSHFLLQDGPGSVYVDADGIISLKKDLYLI